MIFCTNGRISRKALRLSVIALGVALAGGLVAGLTATDADAAPKRRAQRVDQSNPNVSYQAGPRTRVYISRRSWLDAGTEVLPGERKFTDYAFPPGPSFGEQNLNRPLTRQPFYPASDLGGYPRGIPLY